VTPRLAYRVHAGETWVALLTRDGQHLITAGADKTVQVRRAKTEVMALQAPTGLVAGTAYSPDGKWLAAGCGDTSIKLYDRKTGRLVRRLTGHTQAVWSVTFSADSSLLASGGGRFQEKGEAGEVKIWDVATGKEKQSLEGMKSIVTGLAFTPDGKTLAGCGWGGGVRLWDVEKGKQRHAFAGFTKGATARGLSMSKDGKTLAVAGFDGTVRLYDPQAAKEIGILKTPEAVAHGVSFSPDGESVVVACNPLGNADAPLWSGKGPGKVVVIDIKTKKEVRRLEWTTGKALAVAFSPDGQTIATGGTLNDGSAVSLWDAKTGKRITDLRGARQFVGSLAFSSDGRFLAAAGGSQAFPDGLVQWEIAVERDRKVLTGHTGLVSCAALSKDGKILATGSADKSIRLWDTTTWKLKSELTGHTGWLRGLSFSPDGKTLASAGDDWTVRLWDVEAGKEKQLLSKYPIGAKAVAFSPDGTLLATGASEDGKPTGTIKVFDTTTWKERPGEWTGQPGLSLAFSPDGRSLATGAPGLPSLRVYDVKSGKRTRIVQPSSSIRHLAFSPDGSTLATGHGTGGRRGDGSIQLWDTTSWREKGFLRGHGSLCLAVTFSRDGRTLTSGSTDGTARVWDLPAASRVMGPRR
jgi:WD40 repeat protein